MDKIWQLVGMAPGAMLSKHGTTKLKILTDLPLEISSKLFLNMNSGTIA